jgi:hypothetical protein
MQKMADSRLRMTEMTSSFSKAKKSAAYLKLR